MQKKIKKIIGDIVKNIYHLDFKFWSKKLEKSLAQFKPSHIKKNQNWFSPLVYIIALLWTIITIGITIGSFITLFLSLLLLYFIFTQIFGLDLNPENTITY